MANKFPLQTLLDLSNLRLDEAAKQLGQLIASEQIATRRLELLTNYRDEYQTRFLEAAQQGLGPEAWGNYRAFIARLDDAIVQARQLVEQSQRQTSAGQQEWLARHGKVKAFDTLAERHVLKIQYGELRVEQKQNDEFGARQHFQDKGND